MRARAGINATGAPAQAGGDIVLYTVPEAEVEHRLDTLFTVIDDRRQVPPGQTGSIGPRWQPIEAGWTLFTMTPHTHGLGTRVTISRSRGEDDPGEVIVEMADDHAPYWPPVPFDPPLVFGEGEGIRVECEHLNTTGGPLSVGGPRNQEMCGFWAAYDTPATRHRVCLLGGEEGLRCCEVGSPDCDAYYGNLKPPDGPR